MDIENEVKIEASFRLRFDIVAITTPYLNDISPIFLLLYSPLDTALLFDVNAAIG